MSGNLMQTWLAKLGLGGGSAAEAPTPAKRKSQGRDPVTELANQFRGLSGEAFDRIVASFDRNTLIILASAWGAALILIALAYLALLQLGQAKLELEKALAQEPILPSVARSNLPAEQLERYAKQMEKRYGKDLEVIYDKNTDQLLIQSAEAIKFPAWIGALSYLDTLAPQVVWRFTGFCVGGECPGQRLMAASIKGELVNISKPELPTN